MSNCFNPCSKPHPHPHDKEKKCCENKIDIENNFYITQNANANGGDGGDGGDNGDTIGGSAAAAAAVEGWASASSNTGSTGGLLSEESDLAPDPLKIQSGQNYTEEKSLPCGLGLLGSDSATATATGGDAIGAIGGEGGRGGDGGEASNSVAVSVENVIIINCDGSSYPVVSLGTNGRKLDITVDPEGNTLVNGKKMDEETFEDGTKVFIFRNSEALNK